MHNRFTRIALAAAVAATLTAPALADTKTGNLPVSANVIPMCHINTVTGITFTNVDVTALGVAQEYSANGSIGVACTNESPYSISLAKGNYADGGGTRRMLGGSGASMMPYHLYADAGFTTELWGNPTADDLVTNVLGTGSEVVHGVYGRLNKNDFMSGVGDWLLTAGAYSDTVVVTVTF